MPHAAARRASLALAALLVVPAAASAAEPVVEGPTPASLVTGKPAWTIANPPDAFVQTIGLADQADVNELGELSGGTFGDTVRISNFERTATSVASPEILFAGKWWWQKIWRPLNPDGTTGDVVYGAPTQFTVPAYLRKPTIKAPYQDPRYTQFGVSGTVVSNARKLTWRCVVTRGTAVVASKRGMTLPWNAGDRTKWECLSMKVPEANDGKALKLTVTVSAGNKKMSASRSFVGK
jgi:hypothetical protein